MVVAKSQSEVAQAFPHVRIAPRERKPRRFGLTMVIDKSLGMRQTEDLVETASEYIDVVKFGWGTSRLLPESLLEQKIALLRAHQIDVCPGGTFLEIAFDQGCVPEFLAYAQQVGFSAIEVSNGIHPELTAEHKRHLIRQAVDAGFRVFSEVGRKLPEEDERLGIAERVREAREDLIAGAERVIFEARESGTVGIFNANGSVRREMAYECFNEVVTNDIIWEAPQKHQQIWLLQNLGLEVNLGNVATSDAISVETLRLGLRGDTMRERRAGTTIVYLELGVGGALRAKQRGDVIVVVDALRASTTIIHALDRGMRGVVPVVTADQCRGEVSAGERGGQKLPHTDFSNSPTEIEGKHLQGRELVLTATNGIECIRAAKGEASIVLIGSVTNRTAVAHAAAAIACETGRNITLLAAGRNNQPCIEDLIGVTEILRKIESPIVRGVIEPYYSERIEADFLQSDSGRNLMSLGYGKDVAICSQVDTYAIVPIFDGSIITPLQGDAAQP